MRVRVDLDGIDGVTKEFARILKNSEDLSPAMQQIEQEVFVPAARSGWATSGLHSRSGALHGAITPFSGKVSAGIGLRAKGGRRDKGLVFAKAFTHTFGRKKWSSRRVKYKSGWRVSSKGELKRTNRASKEYIVVKSPWGDIPARPFMPTPSDLAGSHGKILKILQDHIHAETP